MSLQLFRFTNPRHRMRMEEGELIQNTTSKLWIERYREAGEFSVSGYVSSGLRKKLPIGSFVSHVDSDEIMVVEAHSVTVNEGETPLAQITGRSLETILEQRAVGSNKDFSSTAARTDYTQPAWKSWTQAESLISRHVLAPYLIDDKNALSYLEVFATPTGVGTEEARTIERGSVYERLLEILAVDNLGIRSVRPGRESVANDPINTCFVIHRGLDRSKTVAFTVESGDVYSADYLWSNKDEKNVAFVSGKWVEVLIDSSKTGDSRRVLYVNASDIDEAQTTNPTGAARTLIVAAMQARGKEALARHNEVGLSSANVTRSAKSHKYRRDYNVGDLVAVGGDFSETKVQRVTEYVEWDDESGSGGYPTLATDPVEEV